MAVRIFTWMIWCLLVLVPDVRDFQVSVLFPVFLPRLRLQLQDLEPEEPRRLRREDLLLDAMIRQTLNG
jgi:hypothetical protein